MRLRNKIAMITGATSGIGAVMARRFAEQGAKVVLAARRSDNGNAIVKEILAAGGQAAFCRMDQANEDEVRAAIEFTVLQYTQRTDCAAGRPWVLKAPHHLGDLPILFRHFPQTTIVHCHRDPGVFVASFCALLHASRLTTSRHVDAKAIGDYALHVYARRMRAYMRDRPIAEQSHPFVDIAYPEIVSNAPSLIRGIYAAAGISLTAASMRAMLDWESGNAQHKHGQHRYALEDYGISLDAIKSVFKDYSARYAQYLTTG